MKKDKHMQQFCLAELHKDFDIQLYKKVASQDKALVEAIATDEARKLYKIHRQVSALIHLKRSFIRFKTSDKGILYATTELEHDVLENLLRIFHHRFPLTSIAIDDSKKTEVIDQKGKITRYDFRIERIINYLDKSIENSQHEKLVPNMSSKEEDELWEEYFKSQCISQRRNIKLMKSKMPKKYLNSGNAEQFIVNNCKVLDEFF